jgi:hypothetical protein
MLAHSLDGYSTNVPLADLAGGALVATHFDDKPLAHEHGGPARLLVPHLYFWKSAKWVNALHTPADEAGFWELRGYHMRGDRSRKSAMADAGDEASHRLSWQPARIEALEPLSPTIRRVVLRPQRWWRPLAGQHLDVRLTAEDGYQAQRSYSLLSPPSAMACTSSASSAWPKARSRRGSTTPPRWASRSRSSARSADTSSGACRTGAPRC